MTSAIFQKEPTLQIYKKKKKILFILILFNFPTTKNKYINQVIPIAASDCSSEFFACFRHVTRISIPTTLPTNKNIKETSIVAGVEICMTSQKRVKNSQLRSRAKKLKSIFSTPYLFYPSHFTYIFVCLIAYFSLCYFQNIFV